MTQVSQKYPELDGLRAIAILLVLARHAIKPFWGDVHEPFMIIAGVDVGSILLNGYIGVDLFFVLSGFLITKHLMEHLSQGQNRRSVLKTYLKRRFFRIAPAYYLILTIACVGSLGVSDLVNLPITQFLPHYIAHLLFLQDFYPPNILPAFWSLAVEAKFYLIAPVFALALMRIKTIKAGIALLITGIGLCVATRILIGFSLASDEMDYIEWFEKFRSLSIAGFDGLFMGAIIATLWHEPARMKWMQKRIYSNLICATGVLLILTFGIFSKPVDFGIDAAGVIVTPTLFALGWGMIVLGMLGGCAGHTLMTGPILRYTAKISYSIYLVHMPLLYVVSVILTSYFQTDPTWGQIIIIWSVFTLIGANLLYFLVEKPFIEWSKKIRDRTGKPI